MFYTSCQTSKPDSRTEWNFLQINNKDVTIDNDLYALKNLPELLGALHYLITKAISPTPQP
ncbi:MAG: hypothetical protein JNM36_06690 [Chitinophagales bacterium]|nr:hypothetical protein [Chitinophagales bacterium]